MRLIRLFILLLLTVPILAQAQPERLVHYEGILNTEDGEPFTGSLDLVFKIYNTPRSETPLWTETHQNVQVTDGFYEVLLGSKNPLKLSFYEYYLEVGAEGMANPGRTMIVGSGYNFRLWFLFAAYSIVWIAIFLFMLSISRRQKRIIAELEIIAQVQNREEQEVS